MTQKIREEQKNHGAQRQHTTKIQDAHVLRSEIKAQLAEFFAEQQTVAAAYSMEFSRLWSLAREHAQGGKLMRPVLMMQTVEALLASETGSTSRSAVKSAAPTDALDHTTLLRLAVAIEILHYSFLLHDDVIDGDLFRRHKPNLIGALRSTQGRPGDDGESSARSLHWARAGGLLMGDLLLAATHQIVARARVPHETRLRLLDLLEHTVFESMAGELTDVGLSDHMIAPELQTVLTMSAHKTATYSFELPLRAAAILTGASGETEGVLTTVGRHLGLAFQLQDDYLSTFGDPREHGKDAFSDLREGKHTAIIAFARTTNEWSQIEQDFGDPELTPERGEELKNLLSECGAERFMRELVEEQTAALLDVCAGEGSSSIPAAARNLLLGLASRLEGRCT